MVLRRVGLHQFAAPQALLQGTDHESGLHLPYVTSAFSLTDYTLAGSKGVLTLVDVDQEGQLEATK